MASKLFRAVVGFGISLGAASAACVGGAGSIEASGTDTTPPPGNTWEPPPGSSWDPPGSSSEGADSTVSGDARADAAADAPKDAMLDAFCDAAWPTTKGNPGGPTCGSVDDCGDAGPAPHCYKLASGSSSSTSSSSKCDPANVTYPAWCVSGAWQCSTGSVPADQCQ